VGLMEAYSIVAGDAPFCAASDLLQGQVPASPAAFVGEVAAVPELAELSALIASRSPTSLTTIFHAHLAARRTMDVEATLASDLRLAGVMARLPDFSEGVRAVLVDKDQRPRWQPARLADVDAAPILDAIKAS
jgi:enoyl-CoA hydratase